MVTMVDVGADRCIPCKMMAPIIEDVREEYEGRAVVAFVDVWKYPQRAEPFKVRVIPTQIFYDATGREVMRHEGFMDKDAHRQGPAPPGRRVGAAHGPVPADRQPMDDRRPGPGGPGLLCVGMVSVLLSPCHLASIPLIVGYVGGQEKAVEGRDAVRYAVAFTLGLFTTIAAIGIACAALGRMLGDIGPWWTVVVGLVLVWVALGMLGVSRCSMSGGLMSRLKVRGLWGALALGLAYGVLSGSCTFGFIAPILAIVTVQGDIAKGSLLMVLFGLGHAIPIAVAGSSTALVRKVLGSGRFQRAGTVFRRLAGGLVGALGIYFMVLPLFGG